MRFIRLASVGLIVRAPSPVTCGGTIDTLFAEDGVVVLPTVLLAGLRTAFVEEDLSEAPDGVKRFS